MPISHVVINASPLIVLFKSGQADLLPQLFEQIIVPQAVYDQENWVQALPYASGTATPSRAAFAIILL
jgi:hypothetical protein